jgi:hypothetical protein
MLRNKPILEQTPQIQCFSTKQFLNRHEGKLLGMDRLASWDIDFKKIITDSYTKYRKGWW